MEPQFVIGPVFSHGGFKNWDLLLFPDKLVTVPKGFGLSLKLGLYAGLSPGLAAQVAREESARTAATGSTYPQPTADSRSPSYSRAAIRDICVKRRLLTASEIRIRLETKELVFGVYDPSRLDEYERAIGECYPNTVVFSDR